jgi:hypothetical protein
VIWAEDGFAPGLPAAETRPGRGHLGSVTVGLRGDPEDFIGGIPMASQWERMATEHGLTQQETEWLEHTVIEVGAD